MLAARTFLAQGFSRESLEAALVLHARCLAGGPGRVLKRGERTRLTDVALADGRRVCVKEVLPRPWSRRLEDLVRPSAPEREWRVAQELARRGVRAPLVHALVRPAALGGGSAFVVMEAIEGALAVNRLALRAGREARRELVVRTAEHLARLHAAGVHHADLKGSNLLARTSSAGLELCLVDLAAVRCRAVVSERERIEALAQLNASTPLVVTRAARLRFLLRYAPSAPRAERARWFRAIERRSRDRKCVWDPDYAGLELAGEPAPDAPRRELR